MNISCRTSQAQFALMLEFMERHGDIMMPKYMSAGDSTASNRYLSIKKWQELTTLLNSEASGKARSEEKWRKVWSDWKNNTKRKWAKIYRSSKGSDNGQKVKLVLSDLEQRVMDIIKKPAINQIHAGMGECQQQQLESEEMQDVTTEEVPSPTEDHKSIVVIQPISDSEDITADPEICYQNWDTPSGSKHKKLHDTPPSPQFESIYTVPEPTASPRKEKKANMRRKMSLKPGSAAKYFIEADMNAREYDRERDRMMFEIEKEKIRQRDMELQLQTQWLGLMRECVSLVKGYLEKKE